MYVVYTHLKLSDYTIFYVGSGKTSRPFSASKRNDKWNRIVKKEKGFAVVIVARTKDKDEALEIEAAILSAFKKQLTNMQNIRSRKTKSSQVAFNPYTNEWFIFTPAFSLRSR